jgi:hypothetical protein
MGPTGFIVRLVDGRSDAEIESRFGRPWVQRLIFWAMARSFAPEAADGFCGVIVYELRRPVSGGPSSWWTIDVFGSRAVASRGVPADPACAALVIHVGVADFVRVGTGLIDPVEPLLQSRATFEGDFGLGARLAEMFQAPTPR